MPEETTAAFLKAHGLWGRGACCLVAVSGGVDSVVLLHALASLREDADLTIHAAHLDHGIREESASDAAFVKSLCSRLNIPCTVGRTRVANWAKGKSLEMAARDIRRSFLMNTKALCGAQVIFTAHHGDDQIETMLLRIARGTSLTGLKGIQPLRGSLARPFLTISRSQIEAYAEQKGLAWVEDVTNRDEQYERNRVRHQVVPVLRELNPRLIGAVNRLSELLARDEELIDSLVQPYMEAMHSIPGGMRWMVQDMHPSLMSRVITAMMDQSGMTLIQGSDVDALMYLAQKGKNGQRCAVAQGYMAYREKEHLTLLAPSIDGQAAEEAKLLLSGKTPWRGGYFTAQIVSCRGADERFVQHFDADRFPEEAVIRTRRSVDRICPLGAPGHMKLKKAMSMRKVPVQARDTWPLIAEGDRILWVPGGQLMDKDIACSEKTCRWLKIQYYGEETSYYGTCL